MPRIERSEHERLTLSFLC